VSPSESLSREKYVNVLDKRVVVVRVFVKKTRKTPRREIALAFQRAGEVLE
jgi:phage-related protein